ncbi:FecCD family ABC transporter permease [Nocardioides sp.]|uniref:FecCD family ABC transporter permease n=1 Tax=Nocardioides sp. TaxID=35761 RepID=UPI0039E2C6A1
MSVTVDHPTSRPAQGARLAYRRIVRRKRLLLGAMLAVCIAACLADVFVGVSGMSPVHVLRVVFRPSEADPADYVIVWSFRLPIAAMALLVGMSLAIAGAQMQTVLDNPLASPYTMGISAAAGFGAALAIVGGWAVLPFLGSYAVAANAFVFCVAACFVILLVGHRLGASGDSLVLAGIALMFTFQALLSLVQYRASPEALQQVVFWLFGSLQRATWSKVLLVGGVLLVVAALLAKDAWRLTALRLGDDRAAGLGINVVALKWRTLVLISLLTAVAVSFVGTIGFVGLVGPHLARMLVGEDQRYFVPMSALCGATLLSTASIASKVIVPGTVYPVGVVTSIIGLPFFISLILSRRTARR